jgi:hypothetical protein
MEIVLGSFLHNLRIPFAGSILTFFSIGLISGFLQIWPYKGLLWRAGLIAALLKSVSPSHIILGPMIGIMSEALLMELSVRALGGGLSGLVLGGLLSMNASLMHKIINLVIMYGWNIARVYLNIFRWLTRQTGWENADPTLLIVLIPTIYAIGGAIAAWFGWKAGTKALQNPLPTLPGEQQPTNLTSFFKIPETLNPIPALIAVHLVSLIATLVLFGLQWYTAAWILTAVYLTFAGIRYKGYLRRFKKPALWLQFAAILAMAMVFGTSLTDVSQNLTENLKAGIIMVIRATMLITALSCIMAELHSPVVKMLASRGKMKHLIHSIESASASIPWILSQLPHPSRAIRYPMHALTITLQLTLQLQESLTEKSKQDNL